MGPPQGPSSDDERPIDRLPDGSKVEVRNGFDGAWSSGFSVIEMIDGRYRIGRRSDDTELPGTFASRDVRRERRRSTWWV